MSNEALTWAFKQEISCADGKFLLVALADYADDQGSCYPGQDRLVRMTGLSLRTVRRQITNLEARGLITRRPRYDRNGHRTSDRYYLCLPASSTTGQRDRRPDQQALPAEPAGATGQPDRVSLRENPELEPKDKPLPRPHKTPTQSQVRSQTAGVDGVDLADKFEIFWSHCRRKVDRKRCLAAFMTACRRGADPDLLIAAMKSYTATTASRDASKVKQPLTWLQGENWNDETHPTTAVPAQGPLAAPAANDDPRWNDPAAANF